MIKTLHLMHLFPSFSLSQMCSCMLSVTMSCLPCFAAWFSCCWWDDVRSIAGELSHFSPSLLWRSPYCLFFTPCSSLSVVVKQPGSVVTQPSSWHCLQRSVVRLLRGGCWGVCQSGSFPGCFCLWLCCYFLEHLFCCISAQYASDTTVSFFCLIIHLLWIVMFLRHKTELQPA